jgi:hypothetical protein
LTGTRVVQTIEAKILLCKNHAGQAEMRNPTASQSITCGKVAMALVAKIYAGCIREAKTSHCRDFNFLHVTASLAQACHHNYHES